MLEKLEQEMILLIDNVKALAPEVVEDLLVAGMIGNISTLCFCITLAVIEAVCLFLCHRSKPDWGARNVEPREILCAVCFTAVPMSWFIILPLGYSAIQQLATIHWAPYYYIAQEIGRLM